MLLLTQLAKVPKIPTDKDCSCSITCDWIGELPIGKLLPITFIIVRPFRKPNSSWPKCWWMKDSNHSLTHLSSAQLPGQWNRFTWFGWHLWLWLLLLLLLSEFQFVLPTSVQHCWQHGSLAPLPLRTHSWEDELQRNKKQILNNSG